MRSRLINIFFIGLSIGSEAIYIHKGNANFLLLCVLIIFATLCIALGGYLDNNHYDQVIDRANGKKGIITSKKIIFTLYSSGVALGTIYSLLQSHGIWIKILTHSFCFLLPAIVLHLYASTLSRYKGIGNIVIAGLCCFSLALPGLTMLGTRKEYWIALSPFLVILFVSTYIREIAKDAEDVKGDIAHGRITLPFLLGNYFTSFFTILNFLVLALVVLGFGLYYNYTWIAITLTSYLIVYNVLRKSLSWRKTQLAWKGFIALGVLLRILFLHNDII
tara:strand:- start:248 stop:1075 length:828 start_codon:yes stop_codon:yes gene_type:complete